MFARSSTPLLTNVLQTCKRAIAIAVVVELLLLAGFLPTLFNPNARIYGGSGGGWDWSPMTFVGPVALLLLIVGLCIDLAVRKIAHPIVRIVTICVLLVGLGVLWTAIVHSE